MINMLWIGRVITGWYNYLFNKTSDESKKRIEICNQCEHRKKIGKAYICNLCGCFLPQKCMSPEEKCLKNKW